MFDHTGSVFVLSLISMLPLHSHSHFPTLDSDPGMLSWPLNHLSPCLHSLPLLIHNTLCCAYSNVNLAMSALCIRTFKRNIQKRKVPELLEFKVLHYLTCHLSRHLFSMYLKQRTVYLKYASFHLHAYVHADGSSKNPLFKCSSMKTSIIFQQHF